MFVKSLTLQKFRNHTSRSFEFNEGINVITGPNAIGKTNIVEAIYYLSLARSFRGVDSEDLVQTGKELAEISADVQEGQIIRHIHFIITKTGRQVIVNGKRVQKISELSKCVNVLLFEPRDVLLFRGSPKDRRSFLDINISKRHPNYLNYITHYNNILKQRNDLLKTQEPDKKLLDSYTEMLVKYAGPIIEYRTKYLKDITDILNKIAHALTSTHEKIEISYKPFVNTSADFQKEALEAFNRSLEGDLKHKATSIGIHREDFSVSLNNKDIGMYGSQGENRIVALALKLAPYFLFEDVDKKPVVVLDDVMSELDATRQKKLINLLRKFSQVFITATELEIDGATQIKL